MPRSNDLDPADAAQLATLLADVPRTIIVRYEWNTEPGKQLIDEIRKLQLDKRVGLGQISDALKIAPHALSNAVGYWKRGNGRRPKATVRDAQTRKRAEARGGRS